MTQALIVDDSPVIRKVARRIFELMQFEVTEAEDGPKALAACAFLMPDIVLLDWNMPGPDGFAVLKELRRMPDGRKPRVVFCTTENDVAHVARAMHAGADDYVLKPFTREIMQAKFEQMGLVAPAAA